MQFSTLNIQMYAAYGLQLEEKEDGEEEAAVPILWPKDEKWIILSESIGPFSIIIILSSLAYFDLPRSFIF